MANKWTRSAAFRFYNAHPRNANWSWSARSSDGKTVVVTLWKDEFDEPAGKMVYARSNLNDWHDGPGRRFFFEDLAWSVAHCDSLVRVIVAVRDPKAPQRNKMVEWYPQKALVMRVVHFDPVTGAFRLEQATIINLAVKHPSGDRPSIANPA